MNIIYSPIGCIHSPFTSLEGMPIQPRGAAQVKGRIEIYPPFRQGLRDLSGFSEQPDNEAEKLCCHYKEN